MMKHSWKLLDDSKMDKSTNHSVIEVGLTLTNVSVEFVLCKQKVMQMFTTTKFIESPEAKVDKHYNNGLYGKP